MPATYTYDPSMITVEGKDRMRFELGDTVVQGGNLTAALCDEEYEVTIAQYWRIAATAPAGWIPDTYQTIWRTASLRGHVFAPDIASVTQTAQEIACGLYAAKRLKKEDEAPVMVNTNNSIDPTADALRTGQIMVDATFGVIVHRVADQPLNHIYANQIEV